MKTSSLALLSIITCFFHFDASAETCDDLDLNACLAAIGTEEANATITEISDESASEIFDAKRALSISTTGDIPLNVLGNEVSLNDLLPLLNIAVDPGTSGDSAGVTLEYSPTQTILGGDIKLGAAIRKPEIADPFREAITDMELLSTLESGLDYSDDLNATFTYSFEGSLFGMGVGRSFDTYLDIADGLVEIASNNAILTVKHDGRFIGELNRGLTKHFQSKDAISKVINGGKLRDLPPAISVTVQNEGSNKSDATDLINKIIVSGSATSADNLGARVSMECVHLIDKDITSGIQAAKADQFGDCVHENLLTVIRDGVQRGEARAGLLNELLNNYGLFQLAGLTNNQPQLLFSVGARFRNELAGGDDFNAKLSFEFDMSGHNINNMWKYHRSSRAKKVTSQCKSKLSKSKDNFSLAKVCAEEIGRYIVDNPIESGGWRGSVSVEYVDRQDGMFEIPGVENPLSLDGGRSLIGSIAVGRQFQITNTSLPKAKLDFSLSYEDVSDDPNRQNRTIGSVTFTQQLAEALQLSVGLVWANKPEYRPSVDEEFSARIGLNYKLSGK